MAFFTSASFTTAQALPSWAWPSFGHESWKHGLQTARQQIQHSINWCWGVLRGVLAGPANLARLREAFPPSTRELGGGHGPMDGTLRRNEKADLAPHVRLHMCALTRGTCVRLLGALPGEVCDLGEG